METIIDILPSSLLPPGPSTQVYLGHLTSLSLSSLLDEPGTLQTQSHHLTSSLSSLIHTAYPTFLSLHDTTRALSSSLSSLSDSLDSLITSSLPNLESSTSSWREKTESLLEERRRARIVLEQHDKVRDLLDIPVLMEACARSGFFAEALNLRNHMEMLVAAHVERSRKTADKGQGRDTTGEGTATQPPEILSSILTEVHYASDQMHLSLLQTLHDPTKKLPALWKSVNFLRKMDVLRDVRCTEEADRDFINEGKTQVPDPEGNYIISSEEQLALAFLTGREACLQSVLDTLRREIERVIFLLEQQGYRSESNRNKDTSTFDRERDDLTRYLKKYIDAWREGVYDIVTQYSTIFLERIVQPQATDTLLHATAANHTQPNSKPALSPPTKKLIARLHALVTTHATHALNTHLLPVLSKSFPLLSMPLLSSLLTQLTYCAAAFSRVGLDFRSVLVGITEDSIELIIARELNDISRRWAGRVKKAGISSADKDKRRDRTSLIGIKKIKVQELPTTWLVLSSAASNPPLPLADHQKPSVTPNMPPQLLASYPPLAALTNALMNTLNGLRLLAPISLFGALKRVMDEDVLAAGGEAVVEYIKQVVGNSGDDNASGAKERKVALAAGQVYFEVLVPFVRRALIEVVYGVHEEEELELSGKLQDMVNHWEKWRQQ